MKPTLARTAMILATTLSFNALAQSPLPAGHEMVPAERETLRVETSGQVPGFTEAQLNEYLAQKMQETHQESLRFVAATPAMAASPDRVVWKFHVLTKQWGGGSHFGFPSQKHDAIYLNAEIKLYLKGEYQMTIGTHPTVLDGDGSHTLAEMARYAAHALAGQIAQEKP